MNCSSCGKKLSKTSKFCPNCGMKVEENSKVNSEEVKEEKDNIVEEKLDSIKNKEESNINVEENTVNNSSNNNNTTNNIGINSIKNSNGAFVASIVVTILSFLTLNFTALTFSIIAIVYLSICKNETNVDLKQRKMHNGKVLNIVSWAIFGIGVIIRIICIVLILIPMILFNEYSDESYEHDDHWEDYYDEDDTYDYDYDEYDNLIEIDFDRFMVLYRKNTPSVVVLVQTTCGYCNMYKPIIDEIAYDENINIYYLDITKLTDSEYNQLINSVDFFENNTKWGTPTTLIVKDSSTVDYLAGYSSKGVTLSFYKKNSIIK